MQDSGTSGTLTAAIFLHTLTSRRKITKNVQASLTELSRQQQEAGYLSGAADSRYILAVSLQSENIHSNLQAAKSLYQQIIEGKIERNHQKNVIPRSSYQLGRYLYSEGKYQEAKAYFEQAIDSPLKWLASVYFKGLTLYHLEMYSDAASWFSAAPGMETCTANAIETLNCLYWVGRSYAAMGNWLEAENKLDLALSSSKAQGGWQFASDCRYHFGRALFANQQYTAAKHHFELLSKTPGNRPATPLGSDYYLGCCLLGLGQFDAAKRRFWKAAFCRQNSSKLT